jgi:PAS domain S-box-containing protein
MPTPSSGARPKPADRATILNVDDSQAGRYSITRTLVQAGFDVLEAATGEEAVSVAGAREPDLIVLDVNLPDINGLEVCARLRADPRTASIPVLHLTATYATSEHWAAALDRGADGYLTEPVEPVVLVATVRALLRARGAEAEVRRAADRWQTTFDAIPHGLAYLDTDGTILRGNRALAQLHGLRVEELAGAGAARPLPGVADLPAADWPFERARRSLRREVSEVRAGERWMEVAVDPVARDGVFLGAVQSVTDITERKRAQLQIQAAVDRLDSVLAGITDAYFAFDAEWRFLEVNRVASETIFRRPLRELLGRPLPELYPAFADSVFQKEYQRAWESGRPVHFEARSAELDRWFEAHAYPHAGRLDVYLRDISDRKEAAAEREHLLERERAARLEAEAANRLKDEFLANLSHELRTPLNAIVGWSAVLRGQTRDPELRRAVDTIDRNARAQSQLIEDILDVSRIVTGKLTLAVEPVDVVTVVGAALESLRPSAEAKRLRVEVRLEAPLPPVLGDPRRLQQVMWNLLSNSVKFTPAEGTVAVTAAREGAGVRVDVRDTGAGIAPEFLPHVFERFRQADSSTTRAHSGLGLGLAIVRHLVELHGGTVEADSPGLGGGATFRVWLPAPRPEASAPAARPGQPEAAPAGRPAVRLDGRRVLVVDDDADTLSLLAAVLQGSGAQTLVAGSADTALETFLAAVPDVLVTDIGLPGQDGYALLAAIRGLPPEAGGHVPAIALTAYARSVDRQRALAAGFQLHLAKPVDPAALVAAIATVLLPSGGAPEPPRRAGSSPSAGPG